MPQKIDMNAAEDLRPQLTHERDLLRYFRDLELFSPFDLASVTSSYSTTFNLNRGAAEIFPWVDPDRYGLNPDKVYGFDIFLAPFLLAEIPKLLSQWIPGVSAEAMPDPQRYEGQSAWLRFSVSSKGAVVADRISVSTLPWALSQGLAGRGLSLQEFYAFGNEISARLVSVVEPALPASAGPSIPDANSIPPLSRGQLEDLVSFLAEASPVPLCPNQLMAIIVPIVLRRKKVVTAEDGALPDDNEATEANDDPTFHVSDDRADAKALEKRRRVDILNSFFLKDLERVAAHCSVTPSSGAALRPLDVFLGSTAAGPAERKNVRDEKHAAEFIERLCPRTALMGAWPRPADQPLALHQDLAVRSYFNDNRSLVAVNGPPGTGKTTIIRDLLAHLVVERAVALSRVSSPRDAFAANAATLSIGRRNYNYRPLRPELCGFECIVVSSNNAAVENISRELPRADALGPEYSDLTYLEPVARLLQRLQQGGKKTMTATTWGLPSVALGRSVNRAIFRRAGFVLPYEESVEETEQRLRCGRELTLFEWRRRADPTAISFRRAQNEFRDCHEEYEAWRRGAQKVAATKLVDAVTSWSSTETQIKGPFFDLEGERLRRKAFIAALRLHEAWIREVPNFERELNTISAVLKNPTGVVDGNCGQVFQLLAMIVPLISSTLASVERMFAAVGAGQLGHVIVDEAGQATPQAVLGILMRAKKALILGDQRQLEPVVIIPGPLERRLRGKNSLETLRHFSPLTSSVQTIADATSPLGTFFGRHEDVGRVWVGLPLCVHRRCGAPMFTLANEIAYDGMMVQASENALPQRQLGPAAWCQVTGVTTSRQWVPEQGTLVIELCREILVKNGASPGNGLPVDLFIISPFREVAARMKSLLRKEFRDCLTKEVLETLLRRVGTVHTFQGKEADLVFFVLGCDFQTTGAADWAGEKVNLVNVAVTRARKWLYVVGDRNVWHNRGYFSDLEKALPGRLG